MELSTQTMSTEQRPDSGKFVSAFARGLRVIEAFGPNRTRLTLAEVAQETGFDRAVTRRLLLTLVEVGMATTDGKQFELTPRVLRLGFSYLGAIGFDDRLRRDLDELSIAVGEAASIGVLDGLEVVLVARSEAAALPFMYAPRTGTRLPAFASSSGRILLAFMTSDEVEHSLKRAKLPAYSRATLTDKAQVKQAIADARRNGYAINVEETIEGVLSVSVPLRARDGRVVAALSVSSHVGRLTPDAMVRNIVPQMVAAASRMSALLL
jgi:IclR family transcriptional regulator, pca regulon regulatory protein